MIISREEVEKCLHSCMHSDGYNLSNRNACSAGLHVQCQSHVFNKPNPAQQIEQIKSTENTVPCTTSQEEGPTKLLRHIHKLENVGKCQNLHENGINRL